MWLGREVSWEKDVFPAWQRAASDAERPNSDVWGYLPPVHWFEAEIQRVDIAHTFVIGTSDLLDVFGSHRLIDLNQPMTGEDEFAHRVRDRAMAVAIGDGLKLERPIVVSDTLAGPFTVLDGNHRVIASQFLGRLVGLPIYLGIGRDIRTYFWSRPAYRTATPGATTL